MLSLTYFSTAAVEFTDDDLVTLLALSRANNEVLGVTGVLFYSGGHFVQTVEGELVDVENLFATIVDDRRHRDVLVAVREDVDHRSYPDWSMGFSQVSGADFSHVPGFNAYLQHGTNAQPEDGSKAHIFHRVFRERMLRDQ